MHPLLDGGLFAALAARAAKGAPGIALASARFDRRHFEAELTGGARACALDVFLPLTDRIMRKRIRRAPLMVLARAGHPALARGLTPDLYLAAGHILMSTRRAGGRGARAPRPRASCGGAPPAGEHSAGLGGALGSDADHAAARARSRPDARASAV
jgi:hypothetical protein